MDNKEFAQTLKEKTKDDFGRYDLRKILKNYNTIEDLREIVKTIVTEFSPDEIKHTWHLSNEMTDEDLKSVCDNMMNGLTTFYDRVKSVMLHNLTKPARERTVITVDDTEDYVEKRVLKTFIIDLQNFPDFSSRYIKYDAIIKKYLTECPDKIEEVKSLAEDTKHLEEGIKEENDICLVRLIMPNSYDSEKGSIQVFPINLVDSLKSNVYMPWGPYEMTEFLCGEHPNNLKEITIAELDDIIQKFITKHDIKPTWD